MKNLYGWMALVMALAMLLMPLAATGQTTDGAAKPVFSAIDSAFTKKSEADSFRLLESDGSITVLSAQDYLCGVVAAEMPALYHDEALKAQAVAAYTFALYRKAENSEKDYDITADITTDQSYLSPTAAAEKWGVDADKYAEKIRAAVAAVEHKKVVKDGKPVLCVYTAISGGRTESAQNVWGKEMDYLVPVESVGDLLCPDYLSSAAFTIDQVAAALCAPNSIASASTAWFASPAYSDSGTVLSMDFGDKTLTGMQIRDALALKSANFTVTYGDGTFYFSVRGYGHLVGMSQYGANYMAMQGSSYAEILSWYYTGCSVE